MNPWRVSPKGVPSYARRRGPAIYLAIYPGARSSLLAVAVTNVPPRG
jgi:hypothetical protein